MCARRSATHTMSIKNMLMLTGLLLLPVLSTAAPKADDRLTNELVRLDEALTDDAEVKEQWGKATKWVATTAKKGSDFASKNACKIKCGTCQVTFLSAATTVATGACAASMGGACIPAAIGLMATATLCIDACTECPESFCMQPMLALPLQMCRINKVADSKAGKKVCDFCSDVHGLEESDLE